VTSKDRHVLRSLDTQALIKRFRRGQEICGASRPAEYWYRLTSGVARRCVVRPDGRRQILDLLLPGDYFGFTIHDQYDFTAEAAVEKTLVACYSRKRAEALANANPEIASALRKVAFDALFRLETQLLILGRVTAVEKVGSFLLEMAARSPNGDEGKVTLPVSRYDMADYLALSVETVSRSITDLKHRGLITLSGTRQVKILKPTALQEGRH
jgi:CRP-like cAMP-binding protein